MRAWINLHSEGVELKLARRVRFGPYRGDIVALLSGYRGFSARDGCVDKQLKQCRFAPNRGVHGVDRNASRGRDIRDGGGDVSPLQDQALGRVQNRATGPQGSCATPERLATWRQVVELPVR